MDLKAFLNPIKEDNIKCVISDRFVDENGRETLLPAIKSVILDIDKNRKVITARPPEWD